MASRKKESPSRLKEKFMSELIRANLEVPIKFFQEKFEGMAGRNEECMKKAKSTDDRIECLTSLVLESELANASRFQGIYAAVMRNTFLIDWVTAVVEGKSGTPPWEEEITEESSKEHEQEARKKARETSSLSTLFI